MPVFYVRSTDGDNADNGSTWALAKATLAGAFAAAAAGDTIYVSESHSEATGADLTLTSPGTIAAPCYVVCGNDAAEPPTALATTGVVDTNGNYNLVIDGSAYYYGLTIRCGTGSTAKTFEIADVTALAFNVFDTCRLESMSALSARIVFGDSTARERSCVWKNVTVKFGGTGGKITAYGAHQLWWEGGSLDVTTAIPAALYGEQPTHGARVYVSGVDLSGLNTYLVDVDTTSGMSQLFFRNCKLHADVTAIDAAILGPGGTRCYVDNCDSGDTNYRMDHRKYGGSIVTETTIKRTGGASDGTTGLCWKMVSLATGPHFHTPLESPPIAVWNETTGSSKTLTVEIVHDSETALTDGEVWVEVEHLGTSGFPLSVHASDRKASFLATAAAQTASTVDWTTTGLTNPNKQKLAVAFTPQEKGPVVARVMLAKASYTVYVCPKVTIT